MAGNKPVKLCACLALVSDNFAGIAVDECIEKRQIFADVRDGLEGCDTLSQLFEVSAGLLRFTPDGPEFGGVCKKAVDDGDFMVVHWGAFI